MTKTLAQINARLAEITTEQAELAKFDYDALLADAIVNGADVAKVEEDQERAQRLANRLRIEHEVLTGMIPEAKRIEAGPQIEKLKKAHATKIAESAKAVGKALEHWEALQAALSSLQQLKAEATNLTNQARGVATESGAADPAAEMGAPTSRRLSLAGEKMGYLGRDLQMWASTGMRDATGFFGRDVDPVAADEVAA